MKYVYSNKASAVRKRIKNLPDIFEKSMRAAYKRDADALAETFEEAISERAVSLEPLKESTVKQKRRKGYLKPKTPLYGKGQYSKMMRVTEGKKKWIVKPIRGKHHSGMTYQQILDLHENGANIKRVSSKGKKYTIQIKPRPARRKAYQLYLRRRKRVDTNRFVWKEINKRIRSAG